MALTEIYVDPSIAADSGTGIISDPYGDLEFCIESETFDNVNGTRINVLAGTDEILAAELGDALDDTSVSVAWVPTANVPLVIQGYTTAAGDGGIGGISGGGSVAILDDTTKNGIHFRDMHLHTVGAQSILDMNDSCSVIGCELDNTTGTAVSLDSSALVRDNYIHNVGNRGVQIIDGRVAYNYLESGVNEFAFGIQLTSGNAIAYRNIVDMGAGSGIGIEVGIDCSADQNSVYCDAGGTGDGFSIDANDEAIAITNNLVEGFSGTGGTGFDFQAGSLVRDFSGNSVYNCETEYDTPDAPFPLIDDNETLTASPFTSASTGDFSPVDTGSVKEGSLPAIIGGGVV